MILKTKYVYVLWTLPLSLDRSDKISLHYLSEWTGAKKVSSSAPKVGIYTALLSMLSKHT